MTVTLDAANFNNILNIGFLILAILAGIFAWLFFSRLKAKRKLVEAELKNKNKLEDIVSYIKILKKDLRIKIKIGKIDLR